MSDFAKSQSHSGSRMEASILHDLMVHRVFEANGIQERESVVPECSKLELQAVYSKQHLFLGQPHVATIDRCSCPIPSYLGQWRQFLKVEGTLTPPKCAAYTPFVFRVPPPEFSSLQTNQNAGINLIFGSNMLRLRNLSYKVPPPRTKPFQNRQNASRTSTRA